VKEYLPENCQRDYDRRMRNAYAMNSYAEAKAALEKIFRQSDTPRKAGGLVSGAASKAVTQIVQASR